MDSFPEAIVNRIVFWLTDGSLNLDSAADKEKFPRDDKPALSFSANSFKFDNYNDVLSLSSTCKRLRQLCGPGLFSFLSLVRISEMDSILNYPKRMDKFSDPMGLRRAYMKEVLETSFTFCGYAEEARRSFSSPQKLDSSLYEHDLSINNYVTHLEASNDVLKCGELAKFPRLKHLKLLDQALEVDDTKTSIAVCPSLNSLSIHFSSLLHSNGLMQLVPQLTRLDIICDFNSLDPSNSFGKVIDTLQATQLHLKQLNLFVNEPRVLLYEDFLAFLDFILSDSPLESLSIRLTRRQTSGTRYWTIVSSFSGPLLLDILSKGTFLADVITDFNIIQPLEFPEEYEVSKRAGKLPARVGFTLVDYSLNVPKLLFNPRKIVANIVGCINATQVSFVYGEVIDNAHLHAIGLMSNLLIYIGTGSSAEDPYCGVKVVTLEKAWSMADDTLVRSHCERMVDDWDAAPAGSATRSDMKRQITAISRAQQYEFSSPRYRRRENYVVIPQPCVLSRGGGVPIMLPIQKGRVPPDTFSTVESSLRDMEHYCFHDKALSSIWD
ncbi:hypothetical protein FT663_01481 [Candidozyma haemuli var. vulneris]|nr:hypothetical protein FT662_02433 [[Candida] haemuloni var. vulneris]KAF3994361.1 hypothetical protein FT663_01481 [[Candida] haemuloni var. vulneris]